MDGMNGWRPKYGQANVGYDMEAARQYPQPKIDDITKAALAGGGVLGAMGAAYPIGLGAAMYPAMRGLGMLEAGSFAPWMSSAAQLSPVIGGVTGSVGALSNYEAKSNKMRDAEGQPGGFYGRKPKMQTYSPSPYSFAPPEQQNGAYIQRIEVPLAEDYMQYGRKPVGLAR